MTEAVHGFWLHLHQACVALSVSLFALRGWAVGRGHAWPMQRSTRYLSVGIDVLLLSAGVTLWVSLGHDPRDEPWLALKLGLLPLYVALGSLALKRGRTPAVRRLSGALALLVVALMLTLARTRQLPWA